MPENNNPFSDNISSLEDDASIFIKNEEKTEEQVEEKISEEPKKEYNDIYNYGEKKEYDGETLHEVSTKSIYSEDGKQKALGEGIAKNITIRFFIYSLVLEIIFFLISNQIFKNAIGIDNYISLNVVFIIAYIIGFISIRYLIIANTFKDKTMHKKNINPIKQRILAITVVMGFIVLIAQTIQSFYIRDIVIKKFDQSEQVTYVRSLRRIQENEETTKMKQEIIDIENKIDHNATVARILRVISLFVTYAISIHLQGKWMEEFSIEEDDEEERGIY